MKASSCQGQCGDTAIFAIFAIFTNSSANGAFHGANGTNRTNENHTRWIFLVPARCPQLCAAHPQDMYGFDVPSPPGPASTDPARERGF